MSRPKYLYFSEKQEYIDLDRRMESYPIGQLLFSVLDIDWDGVVEAAEAFLKKLKRPRLFPHHTIGDGLAHPEKTPYCMVKTFYQDLLAHLRSDSPALCALFSSQNIRETDKAYDDVYEQQYQAARSVSPDEVTEEEIHAANSDIAKNILMLFFEDTPDGNQYMRDAADHDDAVMVEISRPFLQNLRNTCAALGAFQTPLAELVRLGLDLNGEFPELTPAQRLYLLEKSELKPFHSTRKLYDRVQIEPRMLNYKELPIRPRKTVPDEIIAEMKNSAVEPALFYRSDDIRALVFMEFIYMCSQNLAVRKCDYCGRYFLPFSSVSLYCDRIVDTERGRTCKEIAAMQKYNLKVYADAAKTLYRRNVNAYQMRCRRAPACYPHEEYERWKVDARRYLEQVEKGEISLKEFRERVAIPDIK